MDESSAIIELNGLYTQFGEHVVHRNSNLTVHKGEVLSLVGGSGSGKTTLLRQMLGLETPTQGSVKMFGCSRYECNLDTLKSIRHQSGVLFQHGALFSALTVFDNIALPMRAAPPQGGAVGSGVRGRRMGAGAGRRIRDRYVRVAAPHPTIGVYRD